VQSGITHTRDGDLRAVAEIVAQDAPYVANVLRESRLETWYETDERDVEWHELIMDDDEARHWARKCLVGRLTVPNDPGAYETLIEDSGAAERAFGKVLGDLEDLQIVEADTGALAAQEPSSPVRCQSWNGLWFRSGTERTVAEALDRANVLFAPNASVRLGITQDHRDNLEPDFLVIADGKVGVLEVDGPWHTPATAHVEHERDRRFQEHGIAVVQRFGAKECLDVPDDVVTRFLRLLRLNG